MADPVETDNYTFGDGLTGEKLYSQHSTGQREGVCQIGREMAELTVPSVFPTEEYKAGDKLPGNNHSFGAFLINSLASNLAFMAFPPNLPILKFEPDEATAQQEIEADPELWGEMQVALSRLELQHRKGFATTPIQDVYTGYIKLLLVGGNALWRHIRFRSPSFHLPYQYVVLRDGTFNPVLVVFREHVVLSTLDADTKAFVKQIMADDAKAKGEEGGATKSDYEQDVCIYSCQKLRREGDEFVWDYWEEFRGQRIPDTEVTTDYDAPPMWPGGLIPVFGSHWARGYCEEYRGDLFSLEANESSMNDGAALAALALTFVRPGSATSVRQVREAKNLSVLPGAAEDVTVMRSDKGSDLQIVENRIERIVRRLSQAFLIQQAIQRNGERVTAEEIQRMGRDLDRAMGGLYTQIAQRSQRFIVMRGVKLHEEEKPKMVKLPRQFVEVQVITGIDAVGNNSDYTNLVEWAQVNQQVYPKTFETETSGREFMRRTAASKGIKPEGLVKTAAELQQDNATGMQQNIMQSLVDKGTGPAIKGYADAMMAQQQDQPQAAPEGATIQ